MSQVNIHIDPLTTSSMLKHLGQAIEEIKLMRSIDQLAERLRLANALQLDADRRESLAAELRQLNDQLLSLRERAGGRRHFGGPDKTV